MLDEEKYFVFGSFEGKTPFNHILKIIPSPQFGAENKAIEFPTIFWL